MPFCRYLPKVKRSLQAISCKKDKPAAKTVYRGHSAQSYGDCRTNRRQRRTARSNEEQRHRPRHRAAVSRHCSNADTYVANARILLPHKRGIDLIGTINEELLKSAKLTGLWENKLRRISGSYSPASFVREISDMMRQIVINVLSDNSNMRIEAQSPTTKTKTSSDDKPKKASCSEDKRSNCRDCSHVPICGQEGPHRKKGRTSL